MPDIVSAGQVLSGPAVGSVTVLSGGTRSNRLLSIDAREYVFSGGVAIDGQVIAGGEVTIDGGGVLSGADMGGFALGDAIDITTVLSGLTPTFSFTANAAGGLVAVTDGTHSAATQLLGAAGADAASRFQLASDGHGGSLLRHT